MAAADDTAVDELINTQQVSGDILAALSDDLNTPGCITALHHYSAEANKGSQEAATMLKAGGRLLGILQQDDWFTQRTQASVSDEEIEAQIALRAEARQNRDFATADKIRDQLLGQGVRLLDGQQGTGWERM